jgi:hypothetical protein
MSLERNWQGKTCVCGENISKCHLYNKFHVDCHEMEPGLPLWRGKLLITWTILVVMRPGRGANDSECMRFSYHLHAPMVWCWIKHSDNFTGNFYRYRLGVVKKLKYLVLNEMHLLYYFLVSSLNRNYSLNSPDWWRCRSWFRVCLFEKQCCFRLHTNIKLSALSLFTSCFSSIVTNSCHESE